jgi:hypothetical protein
MNEDILKKIGYNNFASEMMQKRASQIDYNDIIMKSEIPRRNPEILSEDDIPKAEVDYSNLEISLPKMKELFIELANIAKSLPNSLEGDDMYDNAFRDNKNSFIDNLDYSAMKLDNMMDEAGIANDPSLTDIMNG